MARSRYRDRIGTITASRGGTGGFVPFKAPTPPPGFYDPSLDAQQAAADRGLFDLGQDIDTQGLRDTVDYGLGRDAIQRGQARGLEDIGSQRSQFETGYGRSVADLNQGFTRGTQDLGTARTRANEDYQRNVGELTRRYGQLGDTQRQQQSRAGVMRGGAMLQAAAKRTANEAIDRQPLDIGHQRFGADNAQSLARLTEDHTTGLSRLGEDRTTQLGLFDRATNRLNDDSSLQLGDLALKMAPPDENNPVGGRTFQDRGTQLTRAQRENTAFGLDAGAQRAYQAAGAGWVPPQMPGNEFVDAYGKHRQVQVRGNQTVAVDPSGNVLWRRPKGR